MAWFCTRGDGEPRVFVGSRVCFIGLFHLVPHTEAQTEFVHCAAHRRDAGTTRGCREASCVAAHQWPCHYTHKI
ncbi:hypothetical protein C2E23DRAFT_816265 [Lenzites betulinus]|nr:hypothetical protein C2E23DRAFT_816265 [Lenzites betulinus]